MLRNFNAKMGRKDILKPKIGNESFHETSNNTGVRVVNFSTSINSLVTSQITKFIHLAFAQWKNTQSY
jgi:hypothetical protein